MFKKQVSMKAQHRAMSIVRTIFGVRAKTDVKLERAIAQALDQVYAEGFAAGQFSEIQEDARDIASVTFEGTAGGDGECFVWHDVSHADRQSLGLSGNLGPDVNPDEVLAALGCVKDKPYRYTVIAERLQRIDYDERSDLGEEEEENEGKESGGQA